MINMLSFRKRQFIFRNGFVGCFIFDTLPVAVMKIHEKLKKARLDAGITQGALAERTGLMQEAISRIENGKHQITAGTLEKICEALGVTIEFIKKG